MKSVPKLQTAWTKIPYVLTDEGRLKWMEEHPAEGVLPEIEVVANKPLTDLLKKDALIAGMTEDEYREWIKNVTTHPSITEGIKTDLNNLGNSWHDKWLENLNVPFLWGPYGNTSFTGTSDGLPWHYLSTPSQEARLAMIMASAPVSAVSAGATNVPITLFNLFSGVGGSIIGSGLGSGLASSLGLNENSLELFGDAFGFGGGAVGGGIGSKVGGTIHLLYSTGLLRGLYDAAKYGIYDRIQGLDIYKSMRGTDPKVKYYRPYENNESVDYARQLFVKRGSGQELTDAESKFIKDSGWPTNGTLYNDGTIQNGTEHYVLSMAGDPEKFTFMQPVSYTRNGNYISTNAYGRVINPLRLFRMGFTTPNGSKLPGYMALADRNAIAGAPSHSFISADAMELTIPESMERNGIFNTLINGNEQIKGSNTWGMSSDATRFFTKLGQQPGKKLVYAGKTGRFNSSGTGPNKIIYEAQSDYENGLISAKEYVDIYIIIGLKNLKEGLAMLILKQESLYFIILLFILKEMEVSYIKNIFNYYE